MVDQQAIEEALRRIGGDTLTDADKGIQTANTEASNHGRVASHAHNSMITAATAKAYRAGLERMVRQIRDYAGAKANEHGKTLAASADSVLKQLVRAQESRISALEGKYPGIKQRRAKFLGSFTGALTTVRDAAVSDLAHTLQHPDDALSWWARHGREVKLATLNAIIAALVSAVVAWAVTTLTAPTAP